MMADGTHIIDTYSISLEKAGAQTVCFLFAGGFVAKL